MRLILLSALAAGVVAASPAAAGNVAFEHHADELASQGER